PGADGRNVHSFWTLDECRGVIASVTPGSHVVMVGAGFISFTILNSILALGAKLTIVEVAPRILPRMVDDAGAEVVESWLQAHGVAIRTNVKVTKIEDAKGKKRLKFASGADLVCDVVIMATGIKTNLDWLKGAGVQINRGIVVDAHLRSNIPNVYAAGDVAEGRDLVSGQPALHAIEPTAQEHGRVVGANMAGKDVAYKGSLIINIVEVCHLDAASFGAWDDAKADTVVGAKRDRSAYRKYLFTGDRLTGAIIIGRSGDVWTTQGVGRALDAGRDARADRRRRARRDDPLSRDGEGQRQRLVGPSRQPARARHRAARRPARVGHRRPHRGDDRRAHERTDVDTGQRLLRHQSEVLRLRRDHRAGAGEGLGLPLYRRRPP